MIQMHIDDGMGLDNLNMTAANVLATARDHYVSAFVRAMAGLGPCHVEPALRLADGTLCTDGVPPTPFRVDLIVKESGERIAIKSTGEARMAAIREPSNGVDIEIGPLAWDLATVDAVGVGPESNEQIRVWFLRWFDPEDTNVADAGGLYGVVHYMSDITVRNSGVNFTVDLGSSPVSAVEDLASVLARLGATEIRIG
jgi:hypothetical protein